MIDFDDLSDVRELAKELPTLRLTSEISARRHGEHLAKLLTDLCDEIDRIRHPKFHPFGKLDPDDPLDQAIVQAFNRGAKKAGAEPGSSESDASASESGGA